VSRTSGGYNAWTGNAWASQYGHAYNSSTGTSVAGRRGAVQNVYTGNYASGAQGAAYNNRTGAAAVGQKATVGNAYTGKSATAARGAVYNPNTGRTTTASGVRTDSGGAFSVGNHTVASHDGSVYHSNGSGGWDQMTKPEQRLGDSSFGSEFSQRSSSFESEARSRDWGEQRAQSFERNRPSFGGFGGGGFGGGGFGGGGFRGGGRR
jgi:hypothetical protein